VTRIYPTESLLPENLLKFYVHFSAPMSRGQIYEHIHLREDSGGEVELPFLQIDEELWDPTMQRLTLIIDPGRIKRGVRPLEEIGPALQHGRRYTLEIDAAWHDAQGLPLKAPFRKPFRVGPADRLPPDPKEWKLTPPRTGRQNAVSLVFPDPMDEALAQRLIHVARQSGEPVNGTPRLDRKERRWTFTPAQPWQPGRYRLIIATTIEDLAGNNIGKPFEVDLFENVPRQSSTASIQLSFEPR
jgi:hypothetical protein